MQRVENDGVVVSGSHAPAWKPVGCFGFDCLWRDSYAFPRRSVGTRNPVNLAFQTTQGWRTQAFILLPCRLEGRTPPQIVMVIQIFISLAQDVDSLPQQNQLIMLNVTLIPRIR